jgi:hypothetical protein
MEKSAMRRGRIDVGLVLAAAVTVLGGGAEGFVAAPTACRFPPARIGHVSSNTRAATGGAVGAGRMEGAARGHWMMERGAAKMRFRTSAAWMTAVRNTALQVPHSFEILAMSRTSTRAAVWKSFESRTPRHHNGLSNDRLQILLLRNGIGHHDNNHDDNNNNDNNVAGCWRLISHDIVHRERREILLNPWRC